MAVVTIQQQPDLCISFGYHLPSSRSIVMDSATPTCFAYSFVVPYNPFSSGSVKLSGFRWYCSAVSSSPKVTAYLLADVSGVPDVLTSALATGTETATISGAGWIDQEFGTPYTLTAGTQYWVALKCTSGTSATIYYFDSTSAAISMFNGYLIGGQIATWRALGDSGTGSSWAGTDRSQVVGVRVKLTNDTDYAYFGLPSSGNTIQNSTNYKINGTNEVGFSITIPDSLNLYARQISMYFRKSGTPGNLSMKVYSGDGTTAISTSNAIPGNNILSASAYHYVFEFSSAVALSSSTKYRFVLSADSGDASNYYYVYANTIDTDSISGGTVDLTTGMPKLCRLTSGAWTDTNSEIGNMAIVPNTAGRFFGSSAGGGSLFGGMVVR